DRQEWVDAQSAGDYRAVDHVEALVHGTIALEDAAEDVYGPLQVVFSHGASAERMRGDQVPEIEEAPRRIGDEAALQGTGVPPQLFVHVGEDLLLAGAIPGDADAPVALGDRRLEQNGAAGAVLTH